MNGKQAKRLRKAAMGLAVTLTESGKDIKKDGYVVKKTDSRDASPSSIIDGGGVRRSAQVPLKPAPRQILVRKDSLKGIYKTLKRAD